MFRTYKASIEFKNDDHLTEVSDWVEDNCKSFIDINYLDMSDISSWYGADCIIEYFFENEEDVMLFNLRWA